VEKGRVYHFRIESRGQRLAWFIDNELFLEWNDPKPLRGPGHDGSGCPPGTPTNWFDNLVIRAHSGSGASS